MAGWKKCQQMSKIRYTSRPAAWYTAGVLHPWNHCPMTFSVMRHTERENGEKLYHFGTDFASIKFEGGNSLWSLK